MTQIFRKYSTPLFWAWVLVFISLSLILISGLYSDDEMNLQEIGAASSHTLSDLFSQTYSNITGGISTGRLTPLTYFFMNTIYWASFGIPLVFKLLLLFFNLLAVYTFTCFLKKSNLGGWIPFALVAYCSTIQFYINYHDAFTSLHAMYPMLAILIFSVLICFGHYLNEGRFLSLLLSLLLAAIIPFYSESGLIIYPIFAILLFFSSKSWGNKVAIFAPFLLIAVIYITAVIYVRTHSPFYYGGVATNFQPSAMWKTFQIQWLAAIPLSSYQQAGIGYFINFGGQKAFPFLLLSVIAFIFFILSADGKTTLSITTGQRWQLLLIGIVLSTGGPAMLMNTSKYQSELRIGMGYLPVYLQDFGIVLFFIVVTDMLFRLTPRFASVARVAVLLVFLICTLLNTRLNYARILERNDSNFVPASCYYKNIKNGLLDDCKPGSTVVLSRDYIYCGIRPYQHMIDLMYPKNLHVVFLNEYNPQASASDIYLIQQEERGKSTSLCRLHQDGTRDTIKTVNYPSGKAFKYFDLISTPL